MIELTFLKELMLIKQVHQKDACHYWHFLNLRCHNLLMMSMNSSDIAILNIEGSDYCCIISLINKNEAINLMQNADLTKKSGTL